MAPPFSRTDAQHGGRRAAALGLLALLAGCAATSGIVPVGPDTYAVSEFRAEAAGGGRAAHDLVLGEAEGFCRYGGRAMQLLDLRPGGDPRSIYWPTAFSATFRCVPPGLSPGLSQGSPPSPSTARPASGFSSGGAVR